MRLTAYSSNTIRALIVHWSVPSICVSVYGDMRMCGYVYGGRGREGHPGGRKGAGENRNGTWSSKERVRREGCIQARDLRMDQKNTDIRRSIRRLRNVLKPRWCTVMKSLIDMVARLYLKSCCIRHWPWCAWESHAAICTCIICTRLLRRFARLDTCLFCHRQCQAVL